MFSAQYADDAAGAISGTPDATPRPGVAASNFPKGILMDTAMSRREAARFLNVSERTLDRLAMQGGGPVFCRIGVRRIVYRRADLEAWMQARAFPHRAAEMAQKAATA